jgi:ribosomal-protein-alanine N-acetyltransferase
MPSSSLPGDKAVLIRRATAADLPAIRALERQNATAAHWSAADYEALFAPDAIARTVLVALPEEPERPELSNDNASLLRGFLVARCTLGEWEVENLVVGEKWRRGGLGMALVRRLLQQVAAAGAASVLLEVRESNLAARQLYASAGFNVVGRRPGYYHGPEEDALLLIFSIAVP